jgi:hypothetical protein
MGTWMVLLRKPRRCLAYQEARVNTSCMNIASVAVRRLRRAKCRVVLPDARGLCPPTLGVPTKDLLADDARLRCSLKNLRCASFQAKVHAALSKIANRASLA